MTDMTGDMTGGGPARWPRALAALVLAAALAFGGACSINPIPTPGSSGGGDYEDTASAGIDAGQWPGADTGGSSQDVVSPSDSVTSPDISIDEDVTEDVAEDVVPGDVAPDDAEQGDLVVTMAPPGEATCEELEEFVNGALSVPLRWTTSAPAVCELHVAVDDSDLFGTRTPGSGDAASEHEFAASVSAYQFWGEAPTAGTLVRWRADCAVPGDDARAQSEWVSVTITEEHVACLWPYDADCSDDGPLICRAPLPPCEGGRVPAIIDGCGWCIYPTTCTCDDGSEPVCPEPEPECEFGGTAAVRDGCWACVEPFTCAAL